MTAAGADPNGAMMDDVRTGAAPPDGAGDVTAVDGAAAIVANDARPPRRRGVALLLVATVAQVAFWYLATPGPTLLDGAPQVPATAVRAVVLSLVTLLALPLATAPLHGLGARRIGLRLGDTRRLLPWLAGALVLAAPVLWWAAGDPALAATYPWPGTAWLAGDGLGSAAWRWLAWAALYGAYYLAFEAFYRGFLLAGLRPWLGRDGALWAQAALATLIHVGKPLAETAAAFPGSLAFGWLALRGRSVLPAVIVHLGIGLLTDAAIVARAS